MLKSTIQINGYNVQLDLNPTNTYSIIRRVGHSSKLLIAGIPQDKLESTMSLILEHEPIRADQSFIVEQD